MSIHVACANCGTFDIVGPGHPAAVYDEEKGQHVLTDRTALRHAHDENCQPNDEGNYPLHFTFLAGVGQVAG